ncbi:hypothetical protein C8F01DRAFT_1295890, partial [Mycena amicta]
MRPVSVSGASNATQNALLAQQKAQKKQELEQRQRRLVLASLVCLVATFTASMNLTDPIPMHTSMTILTGQAWLDKLITGYEGRFREQFGMAKHIFLRLSFELQTCSGLRSTKFVSANEKLATFLHF